MIADLTRLEEIFENMRDDGFDTTKQLCWGFFFFNKKKRPLIELGNYLVAKGYSVDKLERVSKSDWKLQANKHEVLDAGNLHKKNLDFNQLAKTFGIDIYDGWDVE